MDDDTIKRTGTLTRRESEVLALIADGLSNDAISEQLSLSHHTVTWYVRQIFNKLEVKRRTQAVAVARSLGLLSEAVPNAHPHTTLPVSLTPLVGRQAELAQISHLLSQSETRLLTMLGPGGIGKTRLALAVGRAMQEQHGSIVYFVSLEGIHSVEHFIPALAEALGFQFRGQPEPRMQLLAQLRNRVQLLVLDSCEHLLEAVLFFSEMLETCANLKILATSRERLSLRGDTVFRLTGLPYSIDNHHEQNSDAVALFLQSARRADLHFVPDEQDLGYIEHICQIVEGMPLAIELAAGWIKQLSPAQIAVEIEKGLSILKRSGRVLPQRHQSMEAVFAHLWELLTEEEQTIFKNLSVFQGDFDFVAAEQVAGASLSTLKALVNKSHVYPQGQGRYHLHALLRQFGADKLALDADKQQEIQIRYARHYLNQLYQRQHELEGEDSPDAVQELRQDMDNIWAAWRIGGEQCLALEIAQATRSFTLLHSSAGLVANLVEEIEYILPYLREQQHLPYVNLALAETLVMLSPAFIRFFPEKTLQLINEAVAHLDTLETSPDKTLAIYYTFRGIALMALDQYELAVNELQTAVALLEHIKDGVVLVWAAFSLAAGLIELDRCQQARTVLEKAENTVKTFRPFFFQTYTLPALALIAVGLDQYDDALGYLLKTVEENRRYAPPVSFDLFLLATGTYLQRTGSQEHAFEMVSLYFHPVFPNLLLSHKAKRLLFELEADLSLESRQSIARRADDWLSESPSPPNPLGLRVDFLDYVTGLLQPPVQG